MESTADSDPNLVRVITPENIRPANRSRLAHTRYDTFGMVVLEALECGCPIITTRQAGVASSWRLVGRGGGLVDDPRDWSALRDRIERFADHSLRDRQSMARDSWLKSFPKIV